MKCDSKTVTMRWFQWAFYSLHIPCDRVPFGREISSTLWNKSVHMTQAWGVIAHGDPTQCSNRQHTFCLRCRIGLAASSLTDFIHFLVFSFYQCEEETLLPRLLPVWNLFISTSPPFPPPFFTRTLKCGSQEMKRLRRVKLFFPSPHISGSYSFMTKPIHALTAYVPTDVWCRLPPRSRQCTLGSLLPCTPPPPPDSVLKITLVKAGCDVGFGGLFMYAASLIYDRENTLMGVSSKKSV